MPDRQRRRQGSRACAHCQYLAVILSTLSQLASQWFRLTKEEAPMGWNAERQAEREGLKRIIALLLSLAVLAERASIESHPVRYPMMDILRFSLTGRCMRSVPSLMILALGRSLRVVVSNCLSPPMATDGMTPCFWPGIYARWPSRWPVCWRRRTVSRPHQQKSAPSRVARSSVPLSPIWLHWRLSLPSSTHHEAPSFPSPLVHQRFTARPVVRPRGRSRAHIASAYDVKRYIVKKI